MKLLIGVFVVCVCIVLVLKAVSICSLTISEIIKIRRSKKITKSK